MAQVKGGGAARGALKAAANGAATEPGDEHTRSMDHARKAMAHLRALRLPATPRNYEIWYAYATGHYPSLNLILDDLLKRRVALAGNTLEEIGARFVSAGGIKERIDALGTRVAGEIESLIGAIESTIGTAGAQAEELGELGAELPAARDRDTLRLLVEKMVVAAIGSKGERQRLEAQLNTSKTEIAELQAQLQAVQTASLSDPLTKLANRKSFRQALQKAVAAAGGRPLSLMLGDIDRFKRFNDAFGHMMGDQVLRLVAAEMRQHVKRRETVARFGGEEFALLLPDTALQAAYDMAEQIRHAVMSRDIRNRSTGQNFGRVTISFGVAGVRPGDNADALLGRAEACLDIAKRNGRNRVVCEIDPEFSAAEAQPQAAVA